MAFRITYTPRFEKNFKKLSDKERAQFKKKLKIFVENPFHPSLRTKRIQGTEDLFEFSVNMDIRVIWYYENDEIVMTFLKNFKTVPAGRKVSQKCGTFFSPELLNFFF